MIDSQLNDYHIIGAVEQPEHLAESQNTSVYIPCKCQRRKHTIETVIIPAIAYSRSLSFVANLAPPNTVVNEVVKSIKRQVAHHGDLLKIDAKDVNLANLTSSMTFNSSGFLCIRVPRLCGGCHLQGLIYRTCDRRRVTSTKNLGIFNEDTSHSFDWFLLKALEIGSCEYDI